MFTVYGLNGRIFSGPLNGLRELGPVQAVARLRAVEPVSVHVELSPAVRQLAIEGESAPEPRQRDALAAYAQMQQQPAGASPRQPLSLVHELMTSGRPLVTVPSSASLAQGLALLTRERVGQAPVLNPRGRLVGLLLRADLLPQPENFSDAEAWSRWLLRPVSEVMWTPVPSVNGDTPIRELAQALLELRLPGLPVADERGELEGFVSRGDILRALTVEPPLDLWG